MSTRATVFSAAGMAAIAAASVVYMADVGLPLVSTQHLDTVDMSVPDTNGLVTGGRVLLRGISIGHITKITSSVRGISVQWNFDTKYHIPLDSRYRVDNLSALGETYLAVLPASNSGPYLRDHDTIDTAKVVVPTTIKELSERLTKMLEQVDPDRVTDIFRELNIALPDDAQVLGNLSEAGTLLAKSITQQSGNFAKLLSTVQPMLLNSSWMPGDLVGAAHNGPAMGVGISTWATSLRYIQDLGPLRDGIRDGVSPVIAELQKFLDDNATDLHTLGTALLPAARAGAASMETVNVGQLLDNALAATDSDGSVTLHVRTPGR